MLTKRVIVHLNDGTNEGMMGKKMPAVLEEASLSKSNSSDGSDIKCYANDEQNTHK